LKTVSIIGNRPQLVKLIPELGDVVLWTGQHYSDSLKGAYTKQLERCEEVLNLCETQIIAMRRKLKYEIERANPDLVTIYGDTTSTLVGMLSAKELALPIIHIEAGYRCGNMLVPEEWHRVIIDAMCDYLFCPTQDAFKNAQDESGRSNTKQPHVILAGDIMQERLYDFWQNEMGKQIPRATNDKWICTIHRAENSDETTFKQLCKNIAIYVEQPRLYLHPKTEQFFRWSEQMRLSALNTATSYHLIMKELWNCAGVITDSGGLMREAAWLGKPCIVLRNECEFPELVEQKRIKLVGRDEELLRDALEANDWGNRVELENPHTTDKILNHLGIERRFYDTAENELCHASVSV